MTERADRWCEELLPRVAVRQWVLTVPWPRRWLLARRPDLTKGVHRIAVREIQRYLRTRMRKPMGEGGGLTVIQRFGSSLTLNLHFHILTLDGLYDKDRRTGGTRWFGAPPLSQRGVEALVVRIADKTEAWLAKQGLGPEAEREEEPDDALGVIQEAAVAGRSASTGGRRAKRVQRLGGREFALPRLCAGCDGYNLHAGVVIKARDRDGLHRLCRYVARPPLARERLSETPLGRVRIALKRQWSDGSVAIELSRVEFLERLVAQVPPPRANQVLYHGVLAARSSLRRVVQPRPSPRAQPDQVPCLRLTKAAPGNSRWLPWSTLLWKTFQVDGFACPCCNRQMRLRAVVLPPATLDVLSSLERSARGPPG